LAQQKQSFPYGRKVVSVHYSYIYFLTWIKFGISGLQIMPSTIDDFRENRRRGDLLLVGVNEITFAPVP
jgi:hypothetical protein